MKKEKEMKRLGDMEEDKKFLYLVYITYNILCSHDCLSALLLININ